MGKDNDCGDRVPLLSYSAFGAACILLLLLHRLYNNCDSTSSLFAEPGRR